MGEKGDGKITAIYKVDMNCQKCANEVIGAAKDFKGVEDAREDIAGNNKLTVVGKFDPEKLKKHLESKLKKEKKKVELISPQLRKDTDGRGGKKSEENSKKKTEENKPKEVNIVLKATEFQEVTLDVQKGLATFKGTESLVTVKGITEAEVDAQKGFIIFKGIMDGDKKKDDGGGGGGDKKKDGGGGGDKKKGLFSDDAALLRNGMR